MITKDIIKRKPVIVIPVQQNQYYPTVPYQAPWQATKRIVQNAQEWEEYLSTKNWKPGEIICYDWGQTRQADVRSCSVLVGVCTDYDQLKWESYKGLPNYLYLMGLGGYLGVHSTTDAKPYIRWSDDNKMRKLFEEEKEGLLNDNVLDYIQKITIKYLKP